MEEPDDQTDRLTLHVPVRTDAAQIFALYSDPAVWEKDPVSRHLDLSQTDRMITRWRGHWEQDGQGMWVARRKADGELVGIGGCFLRSSVAWNLGFRLLPACWGHGYAQEISRAAMRAATRRHSEVPITAYLLEGNAPSQRTVQALGLFQVWRGADAGNPDPGAVRLLFADRPLESRSVQVLTER